MLCTALYVTKSLLWAKRRGNGAEPRLAAILIPSTSCRSHLLPSSSSQQTCPSRAQVRLSRATLCHWKLYHGRAVRLGKGRSSCASGTLGSSPAGVAPAVRGPRAAGLLEMGDCGIKWASDVVCGCIAQAADRAASHHPVRGAALPPLFSSPPPCQQPLQPSGMLGVLQASTCFCVLLRNSLSSSEAHARAQIHTRVLTFTVGRTAFHSLPIIPSLAIHPFQSLRRAAPTDLCAPVRHILLPHSLSSPSPPFPPSPPPQPPPVLPLADFSLESNSCCLTDHPLRSYAD